MQKEHLWMCNNGLLVVPCYIGMLCKVSTERVIWSLRNLNAVCYGQEMVSYQEIVLYCFVVLTFKHNVECSSDTSSNYRKNCTQVQRNK